MAVPPATSPFVSRGAELAVLRSALERATNGAATTTLVAGGAGVGKSRLVAELAAEADQQGVLVLVGNCVELGSGELPYAPVAGALRNLAARLEPEPLDEVLGPARGELARLVPDLGDASAAATTGSFATARLFELLLGVLGRAGARAPVLLIFEDLHWADSSTRDLLRFLVRSASVERLAIVTTYRLDDLHRADPLRPYVAELARDPRVDRISLREFSRAEFADHVEALLGALPSAGVLDSVFSRSEGNPFFTEELLATADPDAPDALPPSLRDALLVHLARLSDPTQRVVQVLAAAGRQVDYELLAAVARASDDELGQALREAVAGQVLVPRDGAYQFRHELLREAAYAELLPGERERVHAELAAQLEARHTGAAELAHHWHMAGELDRALPASVRAGQEAARAYAYPEALRQYQHALELWQRVSPETRAQLDLVEISAAAALAARTAGELELAIALSGQAIERVDARDEPLRAGVLHAQLAGSLLEAGRGDEARQRSAEALALLPAEPTPERAQVLAAHARLLLLGARIEEARQPIEEAIEIARALGLRDLEADALATRVITLHGRSEEAVAAGEAALLAARDADEPEILVRAHVNAAEALEQAGRLDDAIDMAREGMEVARQAGLERVLGVHLKADVLQRLVKLGRLDEAQAGIVDALRGAPVGLGAAVLQQSAATIAAHRGDGDGTESAVRRARPDAHDAEGGMWNARGAAAVAELELWRGEPTRAWTIVDQALSEVREAEFLMYSAPLYALGAWAQADQSLRARALRQEAEADAARAAIVELATRFDSLLVGAAPPESAAYRAQLDAERGRLEDPPNAAAWEQARQLWAALGFRFQIALCSWREAEALLAGEGDRQRAAALLAEGHNGATELAARPLLEQVEALARRARIALVEPRGDEPPGAELLERTDLSPRELDVLILVAEGRTNREIGAELFISEKTVSVHVSRILTKLGATNRAQAAAIAHRLGLPT